MKRVWQKAKGHRSRQKELSDQYEIRRGNLQQLEENEYLTAGQKKFVTGAWEQIVEWRQGLNLCIWIILPRGCNFKNKAI